MKDTGKAGFSIEPVTPVMGVDSVTAVRMSQSVDHFMYKMPMPLTQKAKHLTIQWILLGKFMLTK